MRDIMQQLTVAFFGHRQTENFAEVESKLEQTVTELLRGETFVEFLVGRNGEFDTLAASVVRRVVKRMDTANASLTLVLPYSTAEFLSNEKSFLDYYDTVEICEQSAKAHYRSAITVRNRYMADRADIIICCIQRKSGGAWAAVSYALRQGKRIVRTNE